MLMPEGAILYCGLLGACGYVSARVKSGKVCSSRTCLVIVQIELDQNGIYGPTTGAPLPLHCDQENWPPESPE